MSIRDYQSFYNNFTPALVEARLIGSLKEGFNVCEEICDRWAGSCSDSGADRVGLFYEAAERSSSQHTYVELKEKSARFANFLASQGIGKGDRVAALLPRTPELMIVILGTLRAGAVYQPLFTAFGPGAIEYRLATAKTKLVVTDATNRSKLDEVKGCPLILMVGDAREGDLLLTDEMAKQPDEFEPVRIGANEPFLQMFTSGTVGKAKGVAVPARAIMSFYVYMRYAIGLRPDDAYWNVADPGWAYGLYYAVIGPMLMGNGTHFNENGFTPETTYKMIRKYAITNLAAAPTAYRMLMANDAVLAPDESLGLRVASSAGEPLNPEVINWVQRRMGCPVMDHYGQTETGMTCCNHLDLEQAIVRVGSMGFSLPGHHVVVLSADFEELGEGEIGQLAVDVDQSPLFFFQGYTWGEKDPFKGRYYLTGDVVMSHGDGSYSFTGRDDDIITTAGYRVGPADVESTLLEHDAVIESGVIGKPDASRGAIIKAYVVIKPQYDPTVELAEELKQRVRDRLSTHAFPREIEFIDELPKTPSGKIQRFILRNQARDEV
ncbi:AMP-binding protein [Neptunomonas antarctica]|uniref:Acetyl-CoA synthetase n=1 Tax=Neptunomonas antarctica TaxID=619304 RepID=A0A1N7JXD2_9GAMM|nr:AMP-binding protein [Neptunomonas antarctica]SIS53977.1 acetyl-CoA synthetase [Neptunomonas antarctica]